MSATPPDGGLTRTEVRARLVSFAARWDQRPGNEQQEAQRFLLELLECYGVDIKADFTFEHHYSDGTRADLFWPGFLLVEMKSASETSRLDLHRPQAFGYWRQSADAAAGVRSPQWLLICSFRRLEIWQPGEFPAAPRATVELMQLPDRLEVLDFLRARPPDFARDAADLASEAVGATADLYRSMIGRGVDPVVAREFTLQATWCMFAEDLDLLPEDNFAAAIALLRRDGELSSFDQLGGLFEWLGRDGERPPSGLYKGVPYANGDLFAHPARVELDDAELELLDIAHGELQSRVHTVWATERSKKLKSDPRYTRNSFASFPWPAPPADVRESIASVAAAIVALRRELCWGNGFGLTKLYNSLEEGGHRGLADLHVRLDDHVAEAYGWPTAAARDDEAIVRGLGVLNRAIVDGELDYDPFGRPSGEATLFE